MSIFIIRNSDTKEPWIAGSGKSAWRTKGAAKNAYIYRGYSGPEDTRPYKIGRYGNEILKFDEQNVYEIIEVREKQEIILDRALELLSVAECLLHGHDIVDEIRSFIEENK